MKSQVNRQVRLKSRPTGIPQSDHFEIVTTPLLDLADKHDETARVHQDCCWFPKDWKTNAPAFIKFVRDHHRPSFLEYGEYPFVSADEIKKALQLKAAFSNMLDQMQ